MTLTIQTYEVIALEDPVRQWELHAGELREKPGMSIGHNAVQDELHGLLRDQIDRTAFKISVNAARLRAGEGIWYVPDLVVIPAALRAAQRDRWNRLEAYDEPMPLVVEVWSPSTGGYDIDTKFPAYWARGDAEIWRVHPFERTLIARRRRADGGYDETEYRGGVVSLAALPGMTVDLDALFA